jgi:hypothetical protein
VLKARALAYLHRFDESMKIFDDLKEDSGALWCQELIRQSKGDYTEVL